MSAPRHHPPALGLGLCYWDKARGKQHVHKAWTRRCTPLGHITLYNGCQGWHKHQEALVREKPYGTIFPSIHYALPLSSASHQSMAAGSYRNKPTTKPPRNRSPTVALPIPFSDPSPPNLIPAEPQRRRHQLHAPAHTAQSFSRFPLSIFSALTLLSNLASLDHALGPTTATMRRNNDAAGERMAKHMAMAIS